VDLSENKSAEAKRRVDALVTKAPNDPRALALAASTYASAGDLKGSEALLQLVLRVEPNNVTTYDMLARVYLAQGQLDAARERFEDIARRDPKSVAAETMIGVILQSQNQPKLAQKHFERAVMLDPHAAVAANNLAWLYAQDGGNLDAALALAQSARETLPNRPEINDTLGWIYYRKGLPDLAIPPLEQSVEEQPSNAAYRYHLGLAYLKTEQKAKARRAFEDALRLQPNFAGAEEARKLLASLRG
jgi:Tfp pilus assembly protein PilF